MREIWVHNTVAKMLDNDENNLVSGRYLTVANMQETAWAMLPTDTASGAVASFPDGADDVPMESLIVSIEPVQEGSGDPSPDNVRPISGWSAAEVTVNGKTITHEFKDAQGNTLTVYGGEDELVGGKLRVNRAMVDLGTLTWNKINTAGSHWRFWAYLNDMATGGEMLSSQYKHITPTQSYLGEIGIASQASSSNYLVMVSDERFSDAATFNTAMSGVQLCYELATPLEYDLTAEDLRTLYGDNTIFADCGDVSVTYKADIGLYIDKKLDIQNAAMTSSINNITVLDTVKATLSKRRTK